MPSETSRMIIELIRSIPEGRVATYGMIAMLAGMPNGARQVVRILHSRAEPDNLPWFRVLRKDGSIALPQGHGFELQADFLRKEGIEVAKNGKVDLSRFAWKP